MTADEEPRPDADPPAPVLDPASLDGDAELRALVEALHEEREVAAGALWGASQALVLAALLKQAQGPWLVLASTEADAELFADDLAAFGARAEILPSRESSGARAGGPVVHADPDQIRRRLQVAQRMAGPPERRPRLLVASLLSMLQPIPDPADIRAQFLHLQRGQRLDLEDLLERLIASGYTRQPMADEPGEVSLRGDILDLYAFATELPLRIELFDDEVESLRSFDPETQRSLESFERVAVCLVRDAGGVQDGQGVLPWQMLAPTTIVVETEPLRIQDQAEGLRIQSSSHAHALAELTRFASQHRRLALQSLPAQTVNFGTRSVQALSVGIKQAPVALADAVAKGERAVVLCRTPAERHRFGQVLDESGALEAWPGSVEVRIGAVSKGFRLPALDLVLVNHAELAGVSGARARAAQRPAHKVRALQSFFELKVGDLVVHAVHGLARYAGLTRLERSGGEEDHLHLLFADEVSLFVPANRVDLVQRYVGSGGSAAPPLDKVGGGAFRRRREKVERALADLAAELLEVQAVRETKRREAWPADDELVRDMVGSFPYADTPDQVTVDAEVRADLSRERPMDRLLCGDVGFGKTELAVRAAFRVVNGGGQVAVLVPTTVLAQQHYETFSQRLADFPVEVEVVSRYVSGRPARDVLERVAAGKVDVLIGTHRLLSKDVSFDRLGLVIIDEEQRFGVKHKEHFKRLRATTDMLAMTATPIPRTLHMSLSGVRDISALTTPPEGRQEIETVLSYSEDTAVIRETLLREKNRGGQVFFLHNRVESIGAVARLLQELVPECSFVVGHGQMGGRELSRVMRTFSSGEADVLVATTIIENGLDIPAAGTIVIDRADTFGLSELHQLRGRVGRGAHKSYCYLLIDRSRPISRVARERLKALEEMSHLGAGFQISMKDLEIRGAGNILGPQQSGHIAAVGYDMYCRLLKQTIERMQAGLSVEDGASGESLAAGVDLELGLEAYLPEAWIPAQDTRLEVLRMLDTIDSDAAADEAREKLRDRFGRLPPEAEALIRSFRLRARVAPLGIERITLRGDGYLLEFSDRVALERVLRDDRVELRPIRTGVARLMVPEGRRAPERSLEWLEQLLEVN